MIPDGPAVLPVFILDDNAMQHACLVNLARVELVLVLIQSLKVLLSQVGGRHTSVEAIGGL